VNNYNIKPTNVRRIFIEFYVEMDDTEIEAASFWLKFETVQVNETVWEIPNTIY